MVALTLTGMSRLMHRAGGRIDTQRIIASGSVVASLQGIFLLEKSQVLMTLRYRQRALRAVVLFGLIKFRQEEVLPLIMATALLQIYQFHQFRLKAPLRLMQVVQLRVQLRQMISAESVSMDFGAISGWATISSIASQSSILLDANQAPNLLMDIENVRASGDVTVRLGAVSEGWRAASISAIQTSNGEVSIEAHAYREKFDVDFISASSVSVAFGDLSDQFYASGIYTNNFTLVGGDGANFSASISELNIGGKDWDIQMAELGNGLEIKSLQFSASGNIFMTMDSDFVSAVSTSAAGDWVETTFDFGEDSSMDVLNYIGCRKRARYHL